MREFKFRAWEHGEMYYQVRCGGIFDEIPTSPTVWIENRRDWVNMTGQPYTKIMQFTGLNDAENKEIYEGDILKCIFNTYGHVFYHDGAFRVSSDQCELNIEDIKTYDDLNKSLIVDNYLIIIGNIYENPELLETK